MIIKEKIREYIIKETMISKEKVKFETKIFDEGMLDSMGLLFLLEFLKEEFNVEVNHEELYPKNFESINSIAAYVESMLK